MENLSPSLLRPCTSNFSLVGGDGPSKLVAVYGQLCNKIALQKTAFGQNLPNEPVWQSQSFEIEIGLSNSYVLPF